MALKDLLGKLTKKEDGVPVIRKGMSPSEVELMSFKEQRRQDDIKKELGMFRQKASNELLTGNLINAKDTISTGKTTILANRSMKPTTNIMGSGKQKKSPNVFFQ